jgi:4-hydroxybenzoate polyprenyltransferase
VALAVILLYMGGMALNDVVDLEVDRRQRPGRPLPSGRISPAAARRFAIFCLLGGWAVTALLGTTALLLGSILAAAIVIYDMIHRLTATSVLLLGFCRGLVYLVSAAAANVAVDWSMAAWFAGALAGYVTLLSLVARGEAAEGGGGWFGLSLLLPLVALAPLAGVQPQEWLWTAVAAALLIAWLLYCSSFLRRRPPRIVAAILGWLAGISLIDGLYLALLQRPLLALVAGACFLLTSCAHRRILGT